MSDCIKEILMCSIDEERAVGIIDHRKGIKKPLTKFSAKIIAREILFLPDHLRAVSVDNWLNVWCWQGFKASWALNYLNKEVSRQHKINQGDLKGAAAAAMRVYQNETRTINDNKGGTFGDREDVRRIQPKLPH